MDHEGFCPLKHLFILNHVGVVKNPSAVQEMQVWSLGWEDSLEQEIATHSRMLAWRIPWTEEPGRLQSKGLQESDTAEHGCTYCRCWEEGGSRWQSRKPPSSCHPPAIPKLQWHMHRTTVSENNLETSRTDFLQLKVQRKGPRRWVGRAERQSSQNPHPRGGNPWLGGMSESRRSLLSSEGSKTHVQIPSWGWSYGCPPNSGEEWMNSVRTS